ncbi:MAG: FxLYD domain-containing protein [Acidobacteriota bacterium]|nr:FxLYD domain-containing protein [Acidobacteriota bacterium]
MASLHNISEHLLEADEFETKSGRSPLFKVISILAAILITGGLLTGFLIWRKKHEEQLAAAQVETKSARPALPTKVQVFMDDAIRKGPQVTISGTVQNISNEKLSNVKVDIALTHKKENGSEPYTLAIDPQDLAPQESGRYSLTVNGDYTGIKLLAVKSGPQSEEIGYKPAQGARRPLERPPETKTIIINRPSSPKQGEEFINTPDNPSKIP